MRALRLLKLALLDLVLSALAAIVFLMGIKGLFRHPEAGAGMLDALLPGAVRKPVYALLIVLAVVGLWRGARLVGNGRGTIVGATTLLARIGLWWSVVALAVFVGVALYGASDHHLSELNWPFALGYLVVTLAVAGLCAFTWQRTISGSSRL
jgi:hypothetical protein